MPRKRQATRRQKRPRPSSRASDVTKAGAVVVSDPELATAIRAQQKKRGKKAPRPSSPRAGGASAASSAGEGSDVPGTDGSQR